MRKAFVHTRGSNWKTQTKNRTKGPAPPRTNHRIVAKFGIVLMLGWNLLRVHKEPLTSKKGHIKLQFTRALESRSSRDRSLRHHCVKSSYSSACSTKEHPILEVFDKFLALFLILEVKEVKMRQKFWSVPHTLLE